MLFTKIHFMKLILIYLVAPALAGAEAMKIEMLDQRIPVELPGDLAINRSNDAGKISYESYQIQGGTCVTSSQSLIYAGLVTLPFGNCRFCQKEVSPIDKHWAFIPRLVSGVHEYQSILTIS
jgi:hypothetical protein